MILENKIQHSCQLCFLVLFQLYWCYVQYGLPCTSGHVPWVQCTMNIVHVINSLLVFLKISWFIDTTGVMNLWSFLGFTILFIILFLFSCFVWTCKVQEVDKNDQYHHLIVINWSIWQLMLHWCATSWYAKYQLFAQCDQLFCPFISWSMKIRKISSCSYSLVLMYFVKFMWCTNLLFLRWKKKK